MEHTSTKPQEPSEADLQLASITENYGERNATDLIAIFSDKHPELASEEIVKMIYDTDMADLPRSSSWPDTTLDRVLIFR
jgi:hypothetical protein